MSLTATDLSEIRSVIESALNRQTQEAILPIQNEIAALINDVKEIYDMIADLQKNPANSSFNNLPLEQKILELNSKLISAAKQAGITLPR